MTCLISQGQEAAGLRLEPRFPASELQALPCGEEGAGNEGRQEDREDGLTHSILGS